MESDEDETQRKKGIDEIEIQIKEEYQTWKENTPFLYDFVIIHDLKCPSLTVEWLPDRHEPAGEDYSVHNMILGTSPLLNNEPNYLMIAQVQLPLKHAEIHDMPQESGINGCLDRKVQIIQKINQDGDVNKARYMPQNPFIIATKTICAEVYVFDRSKHPSEPPPDGAFNPDLRLRGHNEEGFGLSWSKLKQGHLLSGSNDAQICLWDINATPENKTLEAMQMFKAHERVEDVAWHLRHENLFGSVGDDRWLHVWDLRSETADKPVQSVLAHQREVNCLAFNPLNERFVATGSRDNTVKVFDLRMFHTALDTFDRHKEDVVQVGWNPENENILASACHGRRLIVWDRSRIGEEQTAEDAEKGPPEVLFTHEGHTNKISDLSWNPNEERVVASVAGDNKLQIWKHKSAPRIN